MVQYELPPQTRLTIAEIDLPLTRKKLARLEHVLVLVPRSGRGIAWKTIPSADALRRLERRNRAPGAVPSAFTRLTNDAQTVISLCRVDPRAGAFAQLETARRAIAHVLGTNPSSLAVMLNGFDAADADALAERVCAAALAAVAPTPTHKNKPAKAPRLRRLSLNGGRVDLTAVQAQHAGNHLARYLTMLPPNELDARGYRERIEQLAKTHGWKMTFLDRKALAKQGAGAFLAVARAGNEHAGIVHLRYRPENADVAPDLALVGKGVCFDTGGVNVKPARFMQNMHDDMQGSAVALGVLTALTHLESPLAVDCWLAITENLIGREAYKPQEVITALNGTTIEIMHTDAEGRMILADTLSLAAATAPRAMIDYATLTGACVNAVTERYSGVFTNRTGLNDALIAAGAASGERVWPFPMDDDFDKGLESPIADIRQCRLEGGGDHILAARFLSRFCGDGTWVHVDLSAGRHKGGLAHVPTDITGFGVRLTLNLLLEQSLLDQD